MRAHSAFVSLLIAVLVAACGGAQSPIIPQPMAPSANAQSLQSWMLPEAKNEDLLYVADYSDVLVYTYPQGKLVGALKGFYSNVGECVDGKGDVFVTNARPRGVYKYAHGGTKRLAFYKTTAIGAVGCAISPTNGDLAISGFASYVEIYKAAKSKRIVVNDSHMFSNQFDTYDSDGDLFVLGLRNPKGTQQLSELRGGSTNFITIKADTHVYVEGGIQWNDGLLTALSDTKDVNLYRFQIAGGRAHEVGATPLDAAYIVLQYFIDGNTLVVPNRRKSARSEVLYYKYPAGGQPAFTLPGNDDGARGVVVSPATSV